MKLPNDTTTFGGGTGCRACGLPLSPSGWCTACALLGRLIPEVGEAGGGRSWMGHVLLEEAPARGGMGVVWKARHVASGRMVALKMVRLDRMASAEVLGRFRTEMAVAARLSHPHVLPVLEAGEHRGQCYYTTPWAEGGSLASQMQAWAWTPVSSARRDVAIAHRRAAVLLKAIAEGVQHAHERGILHRDLKPENILLRSDGTPQVGDFGIARDLNAGSGLTVGILGTPSHMAPEQFQGDGREVTARTDVWALGVMLYELLAGRLPFAGAGWAELMDAIRTVEPVPPSRWQPGTSRDLETICLVCLAKEPARRYPTAAAVAADLGRFLSLRPVEARRTQPWERLALWARREPRWAVASAAGLAAVAASVAAVLLAWQQAGRHAEDARRNLLRADVHLAGHALNEGNLGRVRELLARHSLEGSRVEPWPWERRFVAGAAATDHVRSFPALPAAVADVAWVPATDSLVALDGASGVTVLACATGAELFRWEEEQRTALVVDPQGRWLATGGYSTVVRRRDASGAVTDSPPLAGGMTRALAVTPDGSEIVALSADGTLRVLGSVGLEVRRSWAGPAMAGLGALLGRLCVPTDGRSVWVAGSREGQVAEYRLEDGAMLREFGGAASAVQALDVSVDRRWMALGRWDGRLELWDVEQGRKVRDLANHRAWVSAVRFSRDGLRVFSSSADQTIRCQDVNSGQSLGVWRGQDSEVWSLALVGGGEEGLISGGKDGNWLLWDARRPSPSSAIQLPPFTAAVRGQNAASMGWDDAGRVLVASGRGRLAGWNTVRGVGTGHWDSGAGEVNAILATPTRGRWLLGLHSGRVVLWSEDGQRPLEEWEGSEHPWVLLDRLPGGRVAGVALDSSVHLWDEATGRRVAHWVARGTYGPFCFSPDGTRLVAGGAPHMARVWDVATGSEVRVLPGHRAVLTGSAVTRDGRWLVTGSEDGTARLWDLATGVQTRVYRGHALGVYAVAVSPDGSRLATGSVGSVRLWDRQTGQEVLSLDPGQGRVVGLTFSPDGLALMASNERGNMVVWRIVDAER